MDKSFESFEFIPEIHSFLKEKTIKKPTEVQVKALPELLSGANVSVLAQTGSGKTLAYALPIVHKLKSDDDAIPMESQFGCPRAIIITPTRELNAQVKGVFKSISHHAKLRIRSLIGGDKGKNSRKISEEAYDILITSPARLVSALKRGEVSLKLMEFFILDEADQLLDMGFTKDITSIHNSLTGANSEKPIQYGFFSATWPPQYENFVEEVFSPMEFNKVICQGGVQLKRNIDTYNIYLGIKEKEKMTESFLLEHGKGTGVIFANRKEDVLAIADKIKAAFPKRRVNSLHGGLTQIERKNAFKEFSEKGGILVASDIAARGLDVAGLGWVLNYDLPFEAVYYIHRCGRTGRDNKLGRVYNFVTTSDSKLMGRINEAILGQSSLALKTLEPPRQSGAPAKAGKPHKKVSKAPKKKVHKKKKAAPKRTPRYKKKKS